MHHTLTEAIDQLKSGKPELAFEIINDEAMHQLHVLAGEHDTFEFGEEANISAKKDAFEWLDIFSLW